MLFFYVILLLGDNMKKILILFVILTILTGCKKENNNNINNNKETTEISFKMPKKYETRPTKDITETIELTKEITLTKSGVYELTGTKENITITIDTEDTIELILSNLNITNTNKEVIKINKAKEVLITLKDKNKFITNDIDTIKSNEIINIGGLGKLTIDTKDTAINSKKDIIIESGTININSNKDAIKSDQNIYIFDTNITIDTKRDGISSEYGIQIQNGKFNITNKEEVSEEDEESRKGIKTSKTLLIENGTFNINTIDDPINSEYDLTINNGNFTLSTKDDGLRADNDLIINNGNIEIKESQEGIESTRVIINNGNIKVNSLDDGINAKAATKEAENAEKARDYNKILIQINGGNINVSAGGDGLDSNGNLELNGGALTVYTLNKKVNEGSLYVTNTITFNGTKVSGTGNISNKIISKEQGILYISFNKIQKKGTTIYLKDKKNKVLNKITPKNDFFYIVFANPDIEEDTYQVYINNKKAADVKMIKDIIKIDEKGKRLRR